MENKIQEICQDVAVSLLQKSVLSVETEYEQQPEVLFVGDVCIGTLGNFSASIGKAKSKKTFNLSAIVAAALADNPMMHYVARLPDDKRRILYVDTEQSTFHCQRVMRRILRLAGLPEDKDCARLQFLTLRKNTPDERVAIIEAAIRNTPNVGMVIIDGVRDLIYDINSPSEATAVISKLMQWTDEYQFHLHTILHQNKGDDNARGHIGTELNNKAETVMQVEKDKNDGNISVVEAIHIRSREFEPFAFRINDDALPELVADYTPSNGKVGRPSKEPFNAYVDITEQEHRIALDKLFAEEELLGYRQIEERLAGCYDAAGVKLPKYRVPEVITFLRNKRMVEQDDKKKYHYLRDFHY